MDMTILTRKFQLHCYHIMVTNRGNDLLLCNACGLHLWACRFHFVTGSKFFMLELYFPLQPATCTLHIAMHKRVILILGSAG